MVKKNKNYSNYLNPLLAVILGLLIIGSTFGANYWFGMQESQLKGDYDKVFTELKENKNKEVNSPIREIFNKISNSSDLVYGLSLFHEAPTKIIKEIEKAVYIGRDRKRQYKIITNENFNFSNYNKVSFGLISTKLEYYGELIKRLKKLYGNVFEIDGLKNFGIQRERTSDGKLTGEIFFTTNITLKYLKGPVFNTNNNLNIDGESEENKGSYQNNKENINIVNDLIGSLALKRKETGKQELYFNSITKDNSIYLGTDIEYNNSQNIYYLNNENNLVDIFSLNKIGTNFDYTTLRENPFKALLITNKEGTEYAICTKVIKENLTAEEEKEFNERGTEFTELFEKGTFKLDSTLKTFCSLL